MKPIATILVRERIGHSPNYRDSASVLFEGLQPGVHELVLDFTDVDFISRGFADQLHKERLRVQEELQVQVMLEHVNEDVRQMMAAVALTQDGAEHPALNIPVIRVADAREFERLLQGC
jgi:hypothetical protein